MGVSFGPVMLSGLDLPCSVRGGNVGRKRARYTFLSSLEEMSKNARKCKKHTFKSKGVST